MAVKLISTRKLLQESEHTYRRLFHQDFSALFPNKHIKFLKKQWGKVEYLEAVLNDLPSKQKQFCTS